MQTVGLLNSSASRSGSPGRPPAGTTSRRAGPGPMRCMRRVEVAERFAAPRRRDRCPRARRRSCSPARSAPPRPQAIARAESPAQALALLLVAPRMHAEMSHARPPHTSSTDAALARRPRSFAPRMAFAAAADRAGASSSSSSAARPMGSTSSRPIGDPGFAAAARRAGDDFAAGPSSTACSRCIPRWSRSAGCTASGQALFVHAVASPYRDRSHFDGQNVLETGGAAAYAVQGRLAQPAAGAAAARRARGDRGGRDGADGAARARAGGVLCAVQRCPMRRTTCCAGRPAVRRATRSSTPLWSERDGDPHDGRRPRRTTARTPRRPAR